MTLEAGDLAAIRELVLRELRGSDLAVLVRQLQGGSPVVTSLPAGRDGQEVYYLADAANGVVWHLRYRAASASAHKWEFIGGSPIRAVVATAQATSNTSYVDLATVGPSVAVPLAGEYTFSHGCDAVYATAGAAYAFQTVVALGGTPADADAVRNAYSSFITVAREVFVTGVGAGATYKCQYKSGGGALATFANRWLDVIPVIVG